MRSNRWATTGTLVLAAALLAVAARADFELTAPDGRRVLLKGDGTWRYLEGAGAAPARAAAGDKPKEAGEAVLTLERRAGAGSICRFAIQLTNNLPYEIRSLVPTFSAVRANGVAYDSVAAGFLSLRPGASQSQEIQFRGIACEDIARLQVGGGDRCVMGEFDRWMAADGSCLKRVRVVASEIVRFDK
jgi:hypothetical protein